MEQEGPWASGSESASWGGGCSRHGAGGWDMLELSLHWMKDGEPLLLGDLGPHVPRPVSPAKLPTSSPPTPSAYVLLPLTPSVQVASTPHSLTSEQRPFLGFHKTPNNQ